METYKDLKVGSTYKNFKGYDRVIKEIHEMPNGTIKITYDDHTGKYRICNAGSFHEWKRKCYY